MDIQSFTVEFLRAGPRHNQLLSPITQYLAVCGNSQASRVTLPYEHGEFERRLQELRYGVRSTDGRRRAGDTLEEIGRDLARILSGISGVSGKFDSQDERTDVLVHMRIVLSASELAMLPFEATKLPTGTDTPSNQWLALFAGVPVCITRQIRAVPAHNINWAATPRVLFIAGPETPAKEHREELEKILKQWCKEDGDDEELLTVLMKPKISQIVSTISDAAREGKPFTHVHVLAHGVQVNENDVYSEVGLDLNDVDDDPVTGRRLASSLSALGQGDTLLVPTVVTLASCDSGRQVDVRTTEAAIAHALHDAGIPLVVASQFPLTIDGSIPFVRRFYEGQLRGEHPVRSLYAVRKDLHSLMPGDVHDWASIVAYESLPANLPGQLEELCYWQARRAQSCALGSLKRIVESARQGKDVAAIREEALEAVRARTAALPTKGAYALECAGLRAAALKKVAMDAMEHAELASDPDRVTQLMKECKDSLISARDEYLRAGMAFLSHSSELLHKKSNLHWLLGQVVSLDVILDQPQDPRLLPIATVAAEVDLENPDKLDQAWAHVSLMEFALLRLAERGLSNELLAHWSEKALAHANRFVNLLGRGSEHMETTAQQLDRYVNWWGNRERQRLLEKLGILNRDHWHVENHGLVPTARKIAALLHASGGGSKPRTRREKPRPKEGSSSPTASSSDPERTARQTGTLSRTPISAQQFFNVEMLPAANGDCLLIEYGEPTRRSHLLVDCGSPSSVPIVTEKLKAAAASSGSQQPHDLFVLTHIDSDHISGVLSLFDQGDSSPAFADIWFNGWHQLKGFLGVQQGEAFSQLLEDPARKLPWNRAFSREDDRYPAPVVIGKDSPLPVMTLPGGMTLTLLSPGPKELKRLAKDWYEVLLEVNPAKAAMLGRRKPPDPVNDFATFDVAALAAKPVKRDPSAANGSSIALLAEFGGRSVLLTGDAHAEVLEKSIRTLQEARGNAGKPLQLDALKLSHHGSANATTIPLLEAITCRNYLVSTNGNLFYHPDRESIARVILHGGAQPTLHFNYRSRYNELWDEGELKRRYGYEARYPEAGTEGLRICL